MGVRRQKPTHIAEGIVVGSCYGQDFSHTAHCRIVKIPHNFTEKNQHKF